MTVWEDKVVTLRGKTLDVVTVCILVVMIGANVRLFVMIADLGFAPVREDMAFEHRTGVGPHVVRECEKAVAILLQHRANGTISKGFTVNYDRVIVSGEVGMPIQGSDVDLSGPVLRAASFLLSVAWVSTSPIITCASIVFSASDVSLDEIMNLQRKVSP